jgi:hypothetical protein
MVSSVLHLSSPAQPMCIVIVIVIFIVILILILILFCQIFAFANPKTLKQQFLPDLRVGPTGGFVTGLSVCLCLSAISRLRN